MKNKVRSIVVAAAAAVLVAAAVTGCGQARTGTPVTPAAQKTTEAPVVKVTEKVTEAPATESETQTETPAPQSETPAPQTETQAPQTETQPQTQPQTTASLSKEEEIAQESEYTDYETKWAMDDINVRETPTTDEDNIFYSLDQGQTATVIGETPNWYEISVTLTDDDGTEQQYVGFVSKQFVSDTEVQPKTEEERAALAAGETTTTETAAPAETQQASAPQETPKAEATVQSQPAASASTASGPSKTLAADANVRADASQTSDVLAVVSAGEQVTVIGEVDGWYQVDYNGVQGYVNKNLVS